jgi:hypothetical protein
MEPNTALLIVLAISSYCAPYTYPNQCFKRIWDCSHNTTHAEVIAFEVHNCIGKEIK